MQLHKIQQQYKGWCQKYSHIQSLYSCSSNVANFPKFEYIFGRKIPYPYYCCGVRAFVLYRAAVAFLRTLNFVYVRMFMRSIYPTRQQVSSSVLIEKAPHILGSSLTSNKKTKKKQVLILTHTQILLCIHTLQGKLTLAHSHRLCCYISSFQEGHLRSEQCKTLRFRDIWLRHTNCGAHSRGIVIHPPTGYRRCLQQYSYSPCFRFSCGAKVVLKSSWSCGVKLFHVYG